MTTDTTMPRTMGDFQRILPLPPTPTPLSLYLRLSPSKLVRAYNPRGCRVSAKIYVGGASHTEVPHPGDREINRVTELYARGLLVFAKNRT
jgi:hypothetical protein